MVLENKRGYTTLMLIFMIFAAISVVGVLGIVSYAASLADDSFSQLDGELGNISFNQTYQDTVQIGLIAAETTMPKIISTGILLGMVILLMIVGYNIRKIDNIWILLDILIIIVAEIAAVAVAEGFRSFINSSPAFLNIFSTTLVAGSKYVLNLPTIVPTVGVLIMLATYFITPKKEKQEEPEVFV